MTDDDLIYIEMVHRARNSGNLAPDRWETSILGAASWAGRLNPLGAALTDWIYSFANGPAYIAKFLLCSEIDKFHICRRRDTTDVAEFAMSWYKDQNCERCDGRGVVDFTQAQCPYCVGLGKKPDPSQSVKDAVGIITSTLLNYNGALKHRMRYEPHPPKEVIYTVRLHHDITESMPLCGQRTPERPRCD